MSPQLGQLSPSSDKVRALLPEGRGLITGKRKASFLSYTQTDSVTYPPTYPRGIQVSSSRAKADGE